MHEDIISNFIDRPLNGLKVRPLKTRYARQHLVQQIVYQAVLFI